MVVHLSQPNKKSYLFLFFELISNTKRNWMVVTSIISPVGNLIGSTTSEGIFEFSLQWIRVSSKSNTKVFLSARIKLTIINFQKIENSVEDMKAIRRLDISKKSITIYSFLLSLLVGRNTFFSFITFIVAGLRTFANPIACIVWIKCSLARVAKTLVLCGSMYAFMMGEM